LSAEREHSEKDPAKHFEVLVFMRGLLKPVYTRMYVTPEKALKADSALRAVPGERVATLFASKASAPNQYSWDIVMQGENETAFFAYVSNDPTDQHSEPT
jgi:protocatechuate 3,4-dioxygenase alpha subunit